VKEKTGRPLAASRLAINRRFGRGHAKVEHVFRVTKSQFGCRQVHYRSIQKNDAQVFTLLALANVYPVRRRLAPA
jgi:transposase, IS5 family